MYRFVVLSLVLSLTPFTWARDLRVDPHGGNDAGDGVSGPVKTIRQAIRLARPGDTIHLKPGVYHEYAGFYNKKGEPGNPIILDGHGATLEGSDPIDPASWEEVEPGLFRNRDLMPKMNRAILARWFFLFDGSINRMGRVLKGKSRPFKPPESLKPGEWTFVEEENTVSGPDSTPVKGAFYIKLEAGQTLADANIRFPIRSSGVAFGGENAHLVIRNITATHPHNDGFNIHGDCRDVRFENIRAIECGDDGISAHETAQYTVDGLVSIGNGTGICDTGASETAYKNVFIAECVGVDLYFLDQGNYRLENAVVLSSAQKPLVVTGRPGREPCRMSIDNLYLRRVIDSEEPALIASHSIVDVKRMTLKDLDLRVTGEMNPKVPGEADIEKLIDTVPLPYRNPLIARLFLERHAVIDESPVKPSDFDEVTRKIENHTDPESKFGYIVFSLARHKDTLLDEKQAGELDQLIEKRKAAEIDWHDVRNLVRVRAQVALWEYASEPDAARARKLKFEWEKWTDLRLDYMFHEFVDKERFQRAAWDLLSAKQKEALRSGEWDRYLKKSTGHRRLFSADKQVSRVLGKPDHKTIFDSKVEKWQEKWHQMWTDYQKASLFERKREFALDIADEDFAIYSWKTHYAPAFRSFAEHECEATRELLQAGYVPGDDSRSKLSAHGASLREAALEKYADCPVDLLKILN